MTFGPQKAAASRCIQGLLAASRNRSQFYSASRTRLLFHMPFRPLVSSVLRRMKSSSPAQSIRVPQTLPMEVPVDEENVPRYDPEAFYPANPGDVLNGRFELLAKLGWGTSSTVWLANDNESNRWKKSNKFVAIKICTRNIVQNESPHELDISIHLSTVKSQHRGRAILGTAIESFVLDSPTGSSHLALVFEPMREPLWLFRRRIMGQDKATRPWMPLVKGYIQILLEGLDFLHEQGHIIHTDLKPDNIMVTFEDQSVIEEFVQGQIQHPMARKTIGNRTVYRCHNNFGDIDGKERLKNMYPKITDFGLAQRGDTPGPHIHPIQPDDCHAPEVILGVGWSYSADIWNFGIMVWDFLAGQGPFQQSHSHPYSPAEHLAEMIALLGPVPPTMIQRERSMRRWQWSPRVRNARGELCSNAAEFYGGPFFTNEEYYRSLFVAKAY
ncbi:serine/threonine-protein kinase, putative [Metarhizium acridum CQMa 102]|uniref:Serine/threonine-protein kinase, putative n=1 Tax=Metarhizium acridum (strain CQMa 102) TaxID=655827 RepID=E9EHN3_METAQ|nr:serine/threonine-protein kinase, putative [Metarhizium acridum CQMa 102]EFY84567.1 serine/threonine-protein kinase, putative [Metarhizium acridum CQMa 102]